MSNLPAYGGYILRVNVSENTCSHIPTSRDLIENYLGGRGFGARILWDEVPRNADPLGPENKLIIASAPLAGLFFPGSSKATFVSKSPATGGYGDSSIGGHLASEMKFAGLDAIIIEGCGDKPVYIYINDEQVEIRDAAKYWGQGCFDTEIALRKELGDEFQVATIGPAGENLVPFALINHDYGRQAGRTGMGAVMGSKKIKAICVRGTKSIRVFDLEESLRISREMIKEITIAGVESWREYGTSEVVDFANEIGALPTHNFSEGIFERASGISAEKMKDEVFKKSKACYSCPLSCGKYSYSSRYDVYIEGPEYETLALLGSNCGLDDIHDVLYANYLCDTLGIDTISAGNSIAFMMNAVEKKMIEVDELQHPIEFGNPKSVFALLQLIATREGIGEQLSCGVKKMADSISKEAAKLAMEIKGLEISGYETRNFMAMLLAYMTCDVGAQHTKAFMIPLDVDMGPEIINEEKVKAVIDEQHKTPLLDCLGICHFMENSLDLYARAFSAATGIECAAEDLMKISERIWNLTRLYWKRENQDFGREWDLPPSSYGEVGLTKGPGSKNRVSLEEQNQLLDMYYQFRGWSKEGLPTKEKVIELGLEEIMGDAMEG